MKKITKIEANQKENPIIRVAAYARVSTDEDAQLVSLKTQKAHYLKMMTMFLSVYIMMKEFQGQKRMEEMDFYKC